MAQKITKNDLVQILAGTNASEIIIVSRGEAKMNKTNNPFYHKEGRSWVPDYVVEKESKTTYDFGGSYEERVNEALVADGSAGTFKTSELTWGEWAVQGRIIKNGDKLYVRVYVNRDNKPEVRYFVDGKEATPQQKEMIRDFTPEKGGSAKQANEGLSEEKQVIPNNIDFDKIITIEVDGTEYEIA